MTERRDPFAHLFERADWMTDAACNRHPELSWFPETTEQAADAKQVCNTECPVRSQCWQHAVDWPEDHGIWGGINMKAHWRANGKGAA